MFAFATSATRRLTALRVCTAAMSPKAKVAVARKMNTLKTSVSELCLEVAQHALMICGINGYRNGSPFSLGRHIRDLLGREGHGKGRVILVPRLGTTQTVEIALPGGFNVTPRLAQALKVIPGIEQVEEL